MMGCFNMADSKTKVFHDECSRIFEINDAECDRDSRKYIGTEEIPVYIMEILHFQGIICLLI